MPDSEVLVMTKTSKLTGTGTILCSRALNTHGEEKLILKIKQEKHINKLRLDFTLMKILCNKSNLIVNNV